MNELDDAQLERYARHLVLREVGGGGQQRLLAARALIIGAGGLGAPLLQYLAAAGVGTITVIDDDAVALSNLQRQVIHGVDDVGAPKVDSAARAVARLNPDVRLRPIRGRLTAGNAAALCAEHDVVCDGSDNFETRFIANDACIAARRPLVAGAIGQFDGQLSVWRPWAGAGLPCYRCLTPSMPPPGTVLSCAQGGVLGAIAGVIGALQAVETLKVLLELGDILAGRLLIYDALSAETRTIALSARPDCPACGDIARAG